MAMTKAELEKDRDFWKGQAENLEDELYALNEAYSDLENELAEAELEFSFCNGIRDIEQFKHRLWIDGIMSKELEEFIDTYLRFYN